jgi:hypothetical protein
MNLAKEFGLKLLTRSDQLAAWKLLRARQEEAFRQLGQDARLRLERQRSVAQVQQVR